MSVSLFCYRLKSFWDYSNWNSIITACRGRLGQCQHLASEEQNVLSQWGCGPHTEFIPSLLPSITTIMTAVYVVLYMVCADRLDTERKRVHCFAEFGLHKRVCTHVCVSWGTAAVRLKSCRLHLRNICATACRFQHIWQLLSHPDLPIRLKQWRKPEKLPNHDSF